MDEIFKEKINSKIDILKKDRFKSYNTKFYKERVQIL
jgi:hypothetical protein